MNGQNMPESEISLDFGPVAAGFRKHPVSIPHGFLFRIRVPRKSKKKLLLSVPQELRSAGDMPADKDHPFFS